MTANVRAEARCWAPLGLLRFHVFEERGGLLLRKLVQQKWWASERQRPGSFGLVGHHNKVRCSGLHRQPDLLLPEIRLRSKYMLARRDREACVCLPRKRDKFLAVVGDDLIAGEQGSTAVIEYVENRGRCRCAGGACGLRCAAISSAYDRDDCQAGTNDAASDERAHRGLR